MNRTLEDYGRTITLTEAEKMSMFEIWDYDSEHMARTERADRIYRRYLKAKGGIPYALRFKAWCKKWGIEL